MKLDVLFIRDIDKFLSLCR